MTAPPIPRLLVVERDGAATVSLIAGLAGAGLRVAHARDAEGARRALAGDRFDAVVIGLGAPRVDGMELMRSALARRPAPCVVLLADAAGARRAAGAMRAGAWDVLARPVDAERLRIVLERGLAHRRLQARLAALEDGSAVAAEGDPFLGGSRAIGRVAEQIRRFAAGPAAVLIEGEPGTGKGAAARALHRQGPRHDGPFVAVEADPADPRGLEADLFGVESSAGEARPGGVERAEGGTLYLDGIADAPPAVQVRLLRLLQDRAFERVGGTRALRADVRFIAGSTRDLEEESLAGRFRDDLRRRLAAARIALPPLRARREDIPALVERFLREANRRHRRRVKSVTRGVLERLQAHDWPGNLRELRDTIEAMVVAAPGGRPLDLADLPDALSGGAPVRRRPEIAPGMTVEEAERALISATLAHVGGVKPRAAAMLGIGLRTLYRKIKAYRLS